MASASFYWHTVCKVNPVRGLGRFDIFSICFAAEFDQLQHEEPIVDYDISGKSKHSNSFRVSMYPINQDTACSGLTS